jgi:hypothetical protein
MTGFAEKHHAMRSKTVEMSTEGWIRKVWLFVSFGGEHLSERKPTGLSGPMIASGTTPIFCPCLFPNQRHEGDAAEVFLLILGFMFAYDLV